MGRTPLEERLQEAQLEMAEAVTEASRELLKFLQKIQPLVDSGIADFEKEQRILRGRK